MSDGPPTTPLPAPQAPDLAPPGQQPPPTTAPEGTDPSREQPWRTLLMLAAPLLVVLGLAIEEDGVSGYGDWTAWAIFATVAVAAQLAPLFASSLSLTPAKAWTVSAIATASLVGYWVVIVLPRVSSNIGFAQTMGVAAAAVACWWSPERRW